MGRKKGLMPDKGGKQMKKGEAAPLLGDTNGDGQVDSADVTVLARHVPMIETIPDGTLLENADVDQDGEVTSEDLAALSEYVSKVREEL